MIASFKLRLTPRDKRTIIAISKALGTSKADVIRMGVRKLKSALESNGWTLDIESNATAKPSSEDEEERDHHFDS